MRITYGSNLEKLGPIEFIFYLKAHPGWNLISQPHDIQGLRIVRFGPREFNKFEIKNLFGSLSFHETNVGHIFGNSQTEQPKTPFELNNVSQPHDILGLQNIGFEPNHSDNSELESFFGTLSLRETNVRQRTENTKKKRPKTAAAELGVIELPLRANSPTRHREVSNTERHCHTRPISASFVSNENMNRKKLEYLKFPSF